MGERKPALTLVGGDDSGKPGGVDTLAVARQVARLVKSPKLPGGKCRNVRAELLERAAALAPGYFIPAPL